MAADLRMHFGEFSLDQRNACVRHGSETLKLKPKAFDVLHYLVEHSGQLVSKDDLWQAIWPDVAVTDGVLAVCLTEIRQALGDDAKAPRFIETVHRRGYRFIGEVVRSEAVASSQHSVVSREELSANGQEIDVVIPVLRASSGQALADIQEFQAEALSESPWIPASAGMTPFPFSPQNDVNGVGSLDEVQRNPGKKPEAEPRIPLRSIRATGLVFMGLVLLGSIILIIQYRSLSVPSPPSLTPSPQPALPLPDKPSLIVLPFVNLSGDSAQEYFSDGLTEVLTGNLSKISSLFVIARNSAFTYKGKAAKVQDVSKEVGVRYVLEGSVQRANQRIRIAVQLIDATTGYHVWSEQYDRLLTDIFALQDEIVQKIVTTLQLQLTLQEEGIIVGKHTDNLEAYDAFLRGLEYFYHVTKEGNTQARQMYEKAIALDPHYAEAYAQLGFTYWFEWSLRWSADPQNLERALTFEQQALALNDLLQSAHAILSLIYVRQQQYDKAIMEGERAVALDPNNPGTYIAQVDALNLAGRPEDALRALAHVMRLTPRSPPPSYAFELGWAYRTTGRYTEAITTLQEFLSRKPDAMAAHLELAVSYLLQWISQQSPADQTLEPALATGQRALVLNDAYYANHLVLGNIYLYQRQYGQALAEIERGVALAPTEAGSYGSLALMLSCMGRTEDVLKAATQALRLKSVVPDEHLANVGAAYAVAGRYEEARAPLQRYLTRFPNILPAHVTLAFVYSELGQEAEARAEVAEVLRLNPKFSLEVHKQRSPIKDPMVLEHHIAALRKVGLK